MVLSVKRWTLCEYDVLHKFLNGTSQWCGELWTDRTMSEDYLGQSSCVFWHCYVVATLCDMTISGHVRIARRNNIGRRVDHRWPPYDAELRRLMLLLSDCGVVDGCKFWPVCNSSVSLRRKHGTILISPRSAPFVYP